MWWRDWRKWRNPGDAEAEVEADFGFGSGFGFDLGFARPYVEELELGIDGSERRGDNGRFTERLEARRHGRGCWLCY